MDPKLRNSFVEQVWTVCILLQISRFSANFPPSAKQRLQVPVKANQRKVIPRSFEERFNKDCRSFSNNLNGKSSKVYTLSRSSRAFKKLTTLCRFPRTVFVLRVRLPRFGANVTVVPPLVALNSPYWGFTIYHSLPPRKVSSALINHIKTLKSP